MFWIVAPRLLCVKLHRCQGLLTPTRLKVVGFSAATSYALSSSAFAESRHIPISPALKRTADVSKLHYLYSVFRVVRRLISLIKTALRWGVFFGGLLIIYPLCKVHRQSLTVWWRLLLVAVENSGPTVQKLGQWMSTRRDLFSLEFCQRFSKLHRHTKEHPWRDTRAIIASHLGKEWEKSFHSFDRSPVGSGCVAQVYVGEINRNSEPWGRVVDKEDSSKVAVKVLHPGIMDCVKVELLILNGVARFLQFIVPSLKYLNLPRCVEEFKVIMEAQVNLEREAASLGRFAKNFESIPNVSFPRVLFSSSDMIVETYEDGVHVGQLIEEQERPGSQTDARMKKVALHGARALLKMIFTDNLVHGDLHPGNVLVRYQTDNSLSSDRAELSRRERFESWLRDMGEEVGKLLLSQAPQHWCQDPELFQREVSHLVAVTRQKTVSLSSLNVGSLLSELLSVVSRHRVELESNFTCVVLAVMVLEGMGRTLDPSLDLLDCARPYLLSM